MATANSSNSMSNHQAETLIGLQISLTGLIHILLKLFLEPLKMLKIGEWSS